MMKQTSRQHLMVCSVAIMLVLGLLLSSAQAQQGRRGPRPSTRDDDAQLEKPPVPKDDYEKKVLGILENILATQRYRNVPPQDGRLLRIMAHSMNAKHIVELGTSTGYSAIWMGLALKQTGGKLTTYEIDAGRAATARENFKQAGMADIITLVEGDAHEKLKALKGTIDMIFLDADKEGYIDYLNKLLPLLRPGGMVVGHNINPRMADPKFMEAITTNPNLETIVRGGVSLSLKKE